MMPMEKKIMIVDDEPAVLELMLRIFNQSGFIAQGTTSGKEAFARISRGGFHLLLTDVHIPDLNGIELIHKVHALFPRMEAMAMSGFGTEATKEKLERLGIFGYIEKPGDPEKIVDLARKALKSDRLIRLHYLHHEPVTCLSRSNILVADDNPAMLKLVEEFLVGHNYRVKTVGNGSQAYEDLLINDYDMIILDINMPVMDGVEAVKAIRQNDPHTFILLMSGEANQSEIQTALQNGANRFLAKPFDLKELLEIVEKINFKKIGKEKRLQSDGEFKQQLSRRPVFRKLADYFSFRKMVRRLAVWLAVVAICLFAGYAVSVLTKENIKNEEEPQLLQKLDQLINAVKEDNQMEHMK
jgi:DNA-binding NtrC family response regulator